MKKFLSVLAISLTSFVFLFVASSVYAANGGPSGANGLRAYPGPGKGQVTVEWQRVSLSGENYSIRYGTTSKVYPYLANHVGYVATYTVGGLTPGKTYYFSLERFWTGDQSVGLQGEVAAIAPAGPVAVVGTRGPVGRNLLVATSAGSGKVKLAWNQYFADSNGWHVVYGTVPGVYQYGVLNAVNTSAGVSVYEYTVGALRRGQRYYFALVPIRNGTAQYITAEVSIVAP